MAREFGWFWILPLGVAGWILGCQPIEEEGPGLLPSNLNLSNPVDTLVAQSATRLGAKLLAEILNPIDSLDAMSSRGNIGISPLSLSMALSMALFGAEAETREEMIWALGYPDATNLELAQALARVQGYLIGNDPKITIITANSAWIRKEEVLLPDWQQNLASMRAEIGQVDFSLPSTAVSVNQWVSNHTQNLIPKMVHEDEDLSSVVAMLLNATLFKAQWSQAFNPQETREDSFHLSQTEAIQARYLHRTEAEVFFLSHEDFTAVSLPFGKGGMEMVFLLPRPDRDAATLAGQLAENPDLIARKNFAQQNMTLSIPKFHLHLDWNGIPALKRLGLHMALSDQAEFGKITGKSGLTLGRIQQATDIEIDETGAKAAAVTRVDVVDTVSISPSVFKAERPFLFVIRDAGKLGTWLFAGVVRNPNQP